MADLKYNSPFAEITQCCILFELMFLGLAYSDRILLFATILVLIRSGTSQGLPSDWISYIQSTLSNYYDGTMSDSPPTTVIPPPLPPQDGSFPDPSKYLLSYIVVWHPLLQL